MCKLKKINLSMETRINEVRKYLINVIPFVILTSSFKIFGYAFTFIVYIPFLINKYKFLINYLKTSNIRIKLSSVFLITMSIYSLIGAITIKDIRVIIFWGTYFIVCTLIYLYHNHKLESDYLYSKNINNIIYFGSISYFILYLIINLISIKFFGNEYQIQKNFWIGGSSSLCISSIFLINLLAWKYNSLIG